MQKEKYMSNKKKKWGKDKEQYMKLNTELKNQSLKHTKKSQESVKKMGRKLFTFSKRKWIIKI